MEFDDFDLGDMDRNQEMDLDDVLGQLDSLGYDRIAMYEEVDIDIDLEGQYA